LETTYAIVPDDDSLRTCTWCGTHINDGMEIAALGIALKPDVDLSDYAGHCIEVPLAEAGRSLLLTVTVTGSEAAEAGCDGLLMLCCDDCRQQLQALVKKEIAAGRLFSSVLAI
jgi:hypothetical protein